MAEIEKTTTQEYWGCTKCEKKMISMKINSDTSMNLFGFGGSSQVFYCDNKECVRYGVIVVVGVRKQE